MSEQYEPVPEHNPDLVELAERAEREATTPPLEYEVAKTPPTDPEIERSENYLRAKAIIETGIAASIAKELPEYRVTVWLEKTHLHEAKNIDVRLSEYLAAYLSKTVSPEEYQNLLTKYNPINEAYLEEHKGEIDAQAALAEKDRVIDSNKKELDRLDAIAHEKSSGFNSGGHHYPDVQSAAAHDFRDDE